MSVEGHKRQEGESTERVRRYRARQRESLICARAETPLELVEQFIETGLLTDAESMDPEAIGKALVRAAQALMDHHRVYLKESVTPLPKRISLRSRFYAVNAPHSGPR